MSKNIHDYAFSLKAMAQLHPPRLTYIITWLILGFLVIGSSMLILIPWQQTAPGHGQIIALYPQDRQQEIHALVSGRIERWFVREGDIIKKGDPIVSLVDNDPNLINRLQEQRRQAQIKLNAANAAIKVAQRDLQRWQNLHAQGLASQRDVDNATITVEEWRGKIAEATAQLKSTDISLSRNSLQTVLAPRDGIISHLTGGDNATYVKEGALLATFAPQNIERAVELYLDGRDIALIKVGDRSTLQFEGWPVIQFSGWPSVAIGTFSGIVSAIDPIIGQTGKFRIIIREDAEAEQSWPSTDFLRIGAKVKGWVILQEVSAGYEIWRQLNNFPPEFRKTDL